MASQTVPAAKRYRISLLLDAYGELLTNKQRTFLRHYFEEDLSFGEIAREYGVSRQAIFDSVKHGEESLENFEQVLRLVENGWARWIAMGVSTEAMAERLSGVRSRLGAGETMTPALNELDELVAELRGAGMAGEAGEEAGEDSLTTAGAGLAGEGVLEAVEKG